MEYLKKRKAAFRAAFKGIATLFRNEPHAKIHLLAAVCAIALAIIFRCSPIEWCAIMLCIGAVIAAEAVNTAVEKLADRITRAHDPLIGSAKDLAAAAVLILAITSVAVALLIFLPKFL